MKLALLVDTWQAFTEKYIKYLIRELKHEVTIFSLSDPGAIIIGNLEIRYLKNSEYMFKSANPNMYSEFLDIVESENFDRIICTRINFPEFFVLDLKTRENFTLPTTIAFYGTNELNGSNIRKMSIKDFLTLSLQNRIILHSNSWINTSNELFGLSSGRIIAMADPIYENQETYQAWNMSVARAKLGIPQKSKVILFFGSMYFGKGLDLLLKAFSLLPNDYWLLVASSSWGINYNFDPSSLNSKRILHLNEFIPEEQVPMIFSAASLVCLPYRKSYEGGTSGVLVQAALAGKPICVPNMKPFSDVIEEFNVGVVFEPESFQSMREALASDHSLSATHSGWNRYISLMSSWSTIAKNYIGD